MPSVGCNLPFLQNLTSWYETRSNNIFPTNHRHETLVLFVKYIYSVCYWLIVRKVNIINWMLQREKLSLVMSILYPYLRMFIAKHRTISLVSSKLISSGSPGSRLNYMEYQLIMCQRHPVTTKRPLACLQYSYQSLDQQTILPLLSAQLSVSFLFQFNISDFPAVCDFEDSIDFLIHE